MAEERLPATLRLEGPLTRPVFDAGIESSFKLSRAYENAQSRAWGLDGLRHVIQPYTDFSYVLTGKNPSQILQFDIRESAIDLVGGEVGLDEAAVECVHAVARAFGRGPDSHGVLIACDVERVRRGREEPQQVDRR